MRRHEQPERRLENRLRAERPGAAPGLISAIVARVGGRPAEQPRRAFRLGLAGALTAAIVVAVTAVGGVGYAANEVSHAMSAVQHVVAAPKPPRHPVVPASIRTQRPTSASVQYVGPPSISSFHPGKGCPGRRVIILGHNLRDITSVTFNGTEASFRVVSNTAIMAIVPDGATTGPITVSGPNGTATSSTDFKVPDTC